MPVDKDLDILDTLSNEELEPLVKLITDKGSLSEMLSVNDAYKKYYPNHKMYLSLIKEELSDMGGNSFANLFRGHGVSYREMLMDVCDKQNIPYNRKASVERIEQCLLEKVLEKTWENMSPEDKEQLLQNLGVTSTMLPSMSSGILISLFRAGGFASYQLSLIIANTICRFIVGRGLSLAANAALTRGLSILAGPIGIALSAVWTIVDIAGPAYRVTQPAVMYIAALRAIQQQQMWKDVSL